MCPFSSEWLTLCPMRVCIAMGHYAGWGCRSGCSWCELVIVNASPRFANTLWRVWPTREHANWGEALISSHQPLLAFILNDILSLHSFWTIFSLILTETVMIFRFHTLNQSVNQIPLSFTTICVITPFQFLLFRMHGMIVANSNTRIRFSDRFSHYFAHFIDNFISQNSNNNYCRRICSSSN